MLNLDLPINEDKNYNEIKIIKVISIKSHEDMVKFFDTEGKDESKWICTDNVGFKYNRLVMFNPFLWHSNGDWFGDTYDNCRLVQLFFFHGA